MAKQTIDRSPERIDYRIVRGDTLKFEIFIPVDPEAATPVGLDLSGSTWACDIKRATDDGTIDPDIEAEVVASMVPDTAQQDEGLVYFELDEAHTRELVPGTFYWYDIQQIRFGDTVTPIHGRLTVLADVTIQGV